MLTQAGHQRIASAATLGAAAGLRLCLRSVTAEARARLEARFGSLDLTNLPGYQQFLQANAAALLPLEATLEAARVAEIVPDWELRTRRTAILEDLARTGAPVETLPMPGPFDVGGVLGTVYVLESSRLDARVHLNTVKRSTDPRVLHATAFLRHGAGHHFWPSFLAILERHATADHETSAVDGAMRALAMFERASVWTDGGALAPPSHA